MTGDRSSRAGLNPQCLVAGQLGHPEASPGLRERRGARKALLEQELPSARQYATVPPAQPLGLAKGCHHQAKLEKLGEVQRLSQLAADCPQHDPYIEQMVFCRQKVRIKLGLS